jgi:hypothetical protein
MCPYLYKPGVAWHFGLFDEFEQKICDGSSKKGAGAYRGKKITLFSDLMIAAVIAVFAIQPLLHVVAEVHLLTFS